LIHEFEAFAYDGNTFLTRHKLTRENGARLLKFFNRQSGKRMKEVIPKMVVVRDIPEMPTVCMRL
jgi:hypothetical protein